MILVQALLTFIVHSLGRVLNMAFGWATVMLFGRVPQERQVYLSVVAFGSVVWLIAVVGIASPAVATVLLAFVSPPRWVEENWIRMAMVAVAVLVPPLVGEAAIRAVNPDKQPRGGARIAGALLSGYRFSLGIALALVALVLVAPVLWGRNFLRRWATRHVPVIVRRSDYPAVLDDVQRALAAGGVRAERGRIGGLLRMPAAILALAAGGRIQALDAEAARLSSTRVEVLLYPFDLMISGDPALVSRAQAIAAEQLPRTEAYMTWSEQGNVFEDRLTRLWRRTTDTRVAIIAVLDEVEGVGREIRSAGLLYEEWEVLLRQVLMLERDLLRRLVHGEEHRRPDRAREAMRGV